MAVVLICGCGGILAWGQRSAWLSRGKDLCFLFMDREASTLSKHLSSWTRCLEPCRSMDVQAISGSCAWFCQGVDVWCLIGADSAKEIIGPLKFVASKSRLPVSGPGHLPAKPSHFRLPWLPGWYRLSQHRATIFGCWVLRLFGEAHAAQEPTREFLVARCGQPMGYTWMLAQMRRCLCLHAGLTPEEAGLFTLHSCKATSLSFKLGPATWPTAGFARSTRSSSPAKWCGKEIWKWWCLAAPQLWVLSALCLLLGCVWTAVDKSWTLFCPTRPPCEWVWCVSWLLIKWWWFGLCAPMWLWPGLATRATMSTWLFPPLMVGFRVLVAC